MSNETVRNFPRYKIGKLPIAGQETTGEKNPFKVLDMSIGGLCFMGLKKWTKSEHIITVVMGRKSYPLLFTPIWQKEEQGRITVGGGLRFDNYTQFCQWRLLNEAMSCVKDDN